MGASYSVDAEIRIKKGKEPALVERFKQFVRDGNARFHEYDADKVNTIDDVMAHLLAKHQNMFASACDDTTHFYRSDFDASYGWEMVMREAFALFAEYLEDESEIIISPDNDKVVITVENGEPVEA